MRTELSGSGRCRLSMSFAELLVEHASNDWNTSSRPRWSSVPDSHLNLSSDCGKHLCSTRFLSAHALA